MRPLQIVAGAGRLAGGREIVNQCNCGSYAINHDPDHKLCDCCWRDRKIAARSAGADGGRLGAALPGTQFCGPPVSGGRFRRHAGCVPADGGKGGG